MVSVSHETPSGDLEVEHAKLRDDVETVRRYGELHPEAWVDLLFEGDPPMLVILMAGNSTQHHESALRELVSHPDQLVVRMSSYPRTRLEEIRQAIFGLVTNGDRPLFHSLGIVGGRVEVWLAADQEALALRFHEKFADAISLKVGHFPFPDASSLDTGAIPRLEPPRPAPPLLPEEDFDVEIDGGCAVISGRTGQCRLLVHNRGNSGVVIETNGWLTARIADPATGELVGGYEGAQAAPLVTFAIPVGGTEAIPLLVGTTSWVQSLGYAIPPGQWSIDAPLQIERRGQFRTPLLPILVVAADD